jgi:3-oxoacyl-[acyl-carrier-protein] synthase II
VKKQIVITGMGTVMPLGIGVENYWSNLIAGKCGIGPITKIDTTDLPVKAAAQVNNFRPRDYLSSRLAADLDTFMQYAYVSAEQALKDSQLEIEPARTGIVMGTALAGLTLTGNTQQELDEGAKYVDPRFISKIMGNMAAAQLSISHNIHGPSLTVGTACSTGGDAIVLANMPLESGAADAGIVMAGESSISPLMIHSLFKAGALSKSGQSRPFDKNRDGFVMAEGGGALILETEEHALKRGAPIKAALLGCADNSDAYHPVSPEPHGDGAAACIRLALAHAGLVPEQIGYINAHGTATTVGDVAEAKAIKQVFGDYAVPVSSTKGATGHLIGASGITEVLACIKAVETGLLPPGINCSEQDPECDLNLVLNEPFRRRIDIAMSNAFGFGGQNSNIIVGRYNG